MMTDPVQMLTGVGITLVTPALVEVAKQVGLPVRFAGLAAMLLAMLLLGIGGIALGEPIDAAAIARWVISGMVYGLAAAGFYSQVKSTPRTV